ncbi:MAG TPA: HDOD domain-containing protein [Opitutaceae bacterium]|nr:HDOD domain-containing protein [Opitutaceae bacterium]
MSTTVSQLIARVRTVYSLPQTFHRLQEVVQNPDSSMSDIGEVLMADQALSARILQLANSSFYGFPSRIETISHAVTMIGAEQMVALVQGTCVASIFNRVPRELVNMEMFWTHSIACGVTARLIAARRREPNTERFFLLGLLHDIGRLVIFQHLPDEAAATLAQSGRDRRLMHQVETAVLGFDHCTVGYDLLRTWKLPSRLCEPIKMHHSYAGSSLYPIETAILHTADVIVNAMRCGSSGERYVPPLHGPNWDLAGLGVEMLGPLQKEIHRQLDEVKKTILT